MTLTENTNQHVLLIDCPDASGLVHRITGVLAARNCNILRNDEFVSHHSNHFFMRTEFSSTIQGAAAEQALIQDIKSAVPISNNKVRVRLSLHQKKNIVLLATKEAHCLGDLLLRHTYGNLHANIQAVISNHQHLQSLVEKFNIPFHYISHKDINRKAHEAAVHNTISIYKPQYLVLAKYMRILTPEFVQAYANRIINIHHSFLPAFIGASPYRQAYNRGVKIIGATAHFVNHELDQGPIIAQDVIPTNHRYTIQEMTHAGRDVEKIVLARALKLVFHDKVFIHNNKTIIF